MNKIEMKTKLDSIEGVFPLDIQDKFLINGGGEPGYVIGYYGNLAWQKIEQSWEAFNAWRAANHDKWGPWIG